MITNMYRKTKNKRKEDGRIKDKLKNTKETEKGRVKEKKRKQTRKK